MLLTLLSLQLMQMPDFHTDLGFIKSSKKLSSLLQVCRGWQGAELQQGKALVPLAPMMHGKLRSSQAGRKVMLPYGDSGCRGSALPLRDVEDGDFEEENGILQASGKCFPNAHASWTEPCLENV